MTANMQLKTFWSGVLFLSKSTQQSSFSFTGDKTEIRKTHKQAATAGGCSKGLTKHLRGGNSELQTQVPIYIYR